MNEAINKLFIGFAKRAEKVERDMLVRSFVEVGPLMSVLSTVDNQILYGRRGTGKTHALVYLSETMRKKGHISIYIDLRNIGSTGGIYADTQIPLAERATRLLMDTLAAVHDELLTAALEDITGINLGEVGPVLDDLASAVTEVVVRGTVEREQTENFEESSGLRGAIGSEVSDKGLKVVAGISSAEAATLATGSRIKIQGTPQNRIHFGRVGNVLKRLSDALAGRRLWLILDEWSVIPFELQPYLADLLRRSLFPISSISVKIGAIEKRSNFQLSLSEGDYIGVELGADASADLNMDDFMVFDNSQAKATAFYKDLIYSHLRSMAQQEGAVTIPQTAAELVHIAFTQENVFREFVRAAEGIPRDAFYILSIAAQLSLSSSISMETIRKASKIWYQRDKESAVSANSDALKLLHWLIDEVIGHRRARAFLLERSVSHELIDRLFDARVLHLLKRNVSALDSPGARYDVYKIDYGCYVDLLATGRSPQGLLETEEGGYIDVPPDDYRAIRRAILRLDEFEKQSKNA